MTVDTTSLDLCECQHPRYEHRWQFWPDPEVYGQCWHGSHGTDGESDCSCSGFELAETHVPLPAPADLIEHGTRYQRIVVVGDSVHDHATGEIHRHRYDRGRIECNRTPPCLSTPWVNMNVPTFSAATIASWSEMQAVEAAMGITITPGREHNIACTCGHPRTAHIYHEGPCRPGYTCPKGCERYEMDDDPADLIENLLGLIAERAHLVSRDDDDLIARARRWHTRQEARGD